MVRRRSTVRFRNGAHRELTCKARSEAHWTALILRAGWELFPYWEEFGRSCPPAWVCEPGGCLTSNSRAGGACQIKVPEYAPRLRARREIEETLALDAAACGWDREVERHRCAGQRIA
jgi:hypothetical protein